MKKKLRYTFNCDYCNKLYVVEHACLKHETHCPKNPANDHKCFQWCEHLEKIVYQPEYDEYDYTPKSTVFHCKKLNKEMYSYIAERRGIVGLVGCERMPLECDEFEGEELF